MREGLYLGSPPVDVRRGASRRVAHSLLRGASFYADAAGGFGQVPAFPPTLQRFRTPAPVNADVRMVELYAQQPALFRQRLASQFRVPRARVDSGHLTPLVPQIGPGANA